MSDLLPLLFWVWLGFSLFIYARRLLRNGSLLSNPGTKRARRLSRVEKAPRPSIDEELAAMAFPDSPQIAKPAPAETGEDVEASPSAVATHTDDPPLALSLAEALAGIKMPCELAPLVATEHTDLRNMLFAATDQPAEMVGTSVADELERLGYNLVPIDDQTIQARRGGTVVEITVYPDKTTATLALGGRATAAPDDVVIVEFQLR